MYSFIYLLNWIKWQVAPFVLLSYGGGERLEVVLFYSFNKSLEFSRLKTVYTGPPKYMHFYKLSYQVPVLPCNFHSFLKHFSNVLDIVHIWRHSRSYAERPCKDHGHLQWRKITNSDLQIHRNNRHMHYTHKVNLLHLKKIIIVFFFTEKTQKTISKTK